MPTVDRQAQLLYGAQWEAFRGTDLDAALGTSECVGISNTLFTRARVKGYWTDAYTPPVTFQAKLDGNAVARAIHYTEKVEGCFTVFVPEAKRGWIVAHEGAHLLLQAGKPKHAHFEGHGKEYAAVYIWAVSAMFGIKWSNRLKRAFAEARVEAVCSLTED